MTSLVIMAAGNSSRYKYCKQVDKLYQDYSLMDFSIYDAFQAGFQKIVLIIRDSHQDFLQQKYQKLIKQGKIILQPQNLNFLPKKHQFQGNRKKPWGTAHCVYCVKELVKENFALINCDDFYGRATFFLMKDCLQNVKELNQFFMLGYPLKKTLSLTGAISRGICVSKEGQLIAIEEVEQIEKINSKIMAGKKELAADTIVSMNFWGFTPLVQEMIEKDFMHFLATENLNSEQEFYLPWVIHRALKKNLISVKLLVVSENWFGLTYPQDRQIAMSKLEKLIAQKKYPKKLW